MFKDVGRDWVEIRSELLSVGVISPQERWGARINICWLDESTTMATFHAEYRVEFVSNVTLHISCAFWRSLHYSSVRTQNFHKRTYQGVLSRHLCDGRIVDSTCV